MDNNYQFAERHILKEAPSAEELEEMAALAGGAANLAATKGKSFKDLNPNLENQEELLTLMVQEPKLLKRPLLWRGTDLVVGFNEEKYRELLDNAQ